MKGRLDEAYKSEGFYWRQKSRIQWLKKRDKNSKFFHAYTVHIRKTNSIEILVKLNGVVIVRKNRMRKLPNIIAASLQPLLPKKTPNKPRS